MAAIGLTWKYFQNPWTTSFSRNDVEIVQVYRTQIDYYARLENVVQIMFYSFMQE